MFWLYSFFFFQEIAYGVPKMHKTTWQPGLRLELRYWALTALPKPSNWLGGD